MFRAPSPPMPPRPDFRRERNQRERILKFKRPLSSLVPPYVHADESTGPTADGAEQGKGHFRRALAGTAGTPFVITEREKRDDAPAAKPSDRKFVEVVHVSVPSSSAL